MSGISLTYSRMARKTYVWYIPDIYQIYDQVTRKTYVWYIPDIFQTYDQMTRKRYARHISRYTWYMTQCVIYQVCHIPGISRNMYDILHNWSYPRYIPRISNFYRVQMHQKLPAYHRMSWDVLGHTVFISSYGISLRKLTTLTRQGFTSPCICWVLYSTS
jgi:hypothetical protein